MKYVRVYRFPIVVLTTSLLVLFAILPLRGGPLTQPFFELFRWVPLVGAGISLFAWGWVTFRIGQAEKAVGPLCPFCGGALGIERGGRYGLYRQCLMCGKNANERYYK